ncbi:MAG TPA: TIGR03619 family F420-dependent LLM class oxidoreductase [Candidatus Dormibacteraeota bacterium]|nr:TIGR03619 family F420-dependent LLM class oxidoreductase [Candidatus Dormibacteraeota bacterium]
MGPRRGAPGGVALTPAGGPVAFGLLASGMKPQGMPPAAEFRRLGARVEELGYDSLWVADRIASGSQGSPLLEGVAALGAFVGFTHRIRLGTSVLVAPPRQPAILAKQLATLDFLSGGRLTVGLGLGENPYDYAAAEVPFQRRGRRVEEVIGVLRGAWAGGPTRYQGRQHDIPEVWLEPGPCRPGGPPLWIGAQADAAVKRAGRLADGWIGFQVTPDRYAERLAMARAAAVEAGRDADVFGAALMIPALVRADGGAARLEAQESFGRRFRREIPMQAIEEMCAVGDPDDCVRKLAAYAAAGVREVILSPLAWSLDPVGDADVLYREVVEPARLAVR